MHCDHGMKLHFLQERNQERHCVLITLAQNYLIISITKLSSMSNVVFNNVESSDATKPNVSTFLSAAE